MARLSGFSLLGLVACDSATPTDTSADAELPCWERIGGSCGDTGDTGTAWLVWHGDFAVADGKLSATRGLAAKNIATGEYVCDIAAEFEGTDAAADPCPDCTFSYSLARTAGGTSGTHCDRWVRSSTIFDQAGYQDFYFGRAMDGFGFAQVYEYNSGTYSFTLESVVFAHLTSDKYEGWYVYGYNYPVQGVYHVRGTAEAATFEGYQRSAEGSAYYYYFTY